MVCQINADLTFIESNNTLDIDSLLAECPVCEETQQQSATADNANESTYAESATSLFDNMNTVKMSIMPHPVNAVSQISVQAKAGAVFTIYNSLGQVVFTEKLESDRFNKTISSQNFEKGLYLISLSLNGELLQSKEMVIIE